MLDTRETPPELPLPPASFTFLVESLMMQTQMQLGIFVLDEEEQPEPNLAIARHSIDLLEIIQEKTRGNLTTEENRMLENGLTELRFRFVQVGDELKRAKQLEVTSHSAEKPLILTADGGKGVKSA